MGGDAEASLFRLLRISEILTWVAPLSSSLTQLYTLCFSDENARADMKKLPTLPTKVLKEHPSLAYWCVPWKRACGST